jgi:hypothetical protein
VSAGWWIGVVLLAGWLIAAVWSVAASNWDNDPEEWS